ncbi:hypothetical protein A2U01_0111035, partial [Trifolium medium]|nr:hypothetical protein [Trifolium medium]
MTGNEENLSDEHIVVNSQSDESKKTVTVNNEDDLSADNNVDTDTIVVNVDDIQ